MMLFNIVFYACISIFVSAKVSVMTNTEAAACISNLSGLDSYSKLNLLGHTWNAMSEENRLKALNEIQAIENANIDDSYLKQIASMTDDPDGEMDANHNCLHSLMSSRTGDLWLSLSEVEREAALSDLEESFEG